VRCGGNEVVAGLSSPTSLPTTGKWASTFSSVPDVRYSVSYAFGRASIQWVGCFTAPFIPRFRARQRARKRHHEQRRIGELKGRRKDQPVKKRKGKKE
jgi:hypothetical protein